MCPFGRPLQRGDGITPCLSPDMGIARKRARADVAGELADRLFLSTGRLCAISLRRGRTRSLSVSPPRESWLPARKERHSERR
jgi:hypothetical protein